MNKTAAIEFLNQQQIELEGALDNDKKKVQALLAKISQAEAELQATKIVLSRHTRPGQMHLSAHTQADATNVEESVRTLIIRAMTEAGKAQTTGQLLGFLASHGKTTSSATVRSTIYQAVKRNRFFRVVTPGVFGLIEWGDKR